MTSKQSTTWLVLVTLGLVFGSAFLSVKILVDVLTPMQVVAARLGLAAFVVLAVLAARRDLPPLRGGLLSGGAVLAVFDCFLPYALIAWASRDIDSGMTAVLMSTLPMFTALFAWRTLPDEALSPARIAGLMLGFAGVAVLVGPDVLAVRGGVGTAHLAAIGAAASYGIATVYARVLCRTEGVIDVTAVKFAFGALLAIGLSAAVDGAPSGIELGARELVALLALGAVSTGLGRLAYLWVIKEAGSVRASLVTYIIPLSAMSLGWLVLGETVSPGMIAGVALIIAGVTGVLHGKAPAPAPEQPAVVGRRVLA